MNKKIGVGIITCNRTAFLDKLISSIESKTSKIDEFVIINDGDSKLNLTHVNCSIINNEKNIGVGKSKNKALKHLMDLGCEYLFLLEDDITILDTEVFNAYIEASEISGIQHFNFAFHGLDNYLPNKTPAIKLKVDYSPTVSVSLFPNVYGAFSFYTKKCIEKVGYMDEFYYNAMEHVDHTLEIIKANMHPPFRWFADITNSNKFIQELDVAHQSSEIRKNQKWIENFHKSANYFANKQGFDVRSPNQPVATKEEVIKSLKNIKK